MQGASSLTRTHTHTHTPTTTTTSETPKRRWVFVQISSDPCRAGRKKASRAAFACRAFQRSVAHYSWWWSGGSAESRTGKGRRRLPWLQQTNHRYCTAAARIPSKSGRPDRTGGLVSVHVVDRCKPTERHNHVDEHEWIADKRLRPSGWKS